MMRKIVAALILCLALSTAQAEVRRLTILHTNDLHARLLPNAEKQGGFAHLATLIQQERRGCSSCLLLNAGDLVQGTAVSTIFKGSPVYEIGNKLGFDAATLGNHEFDYGWRQAAHFVKLAKYPVLSANIVDGNHKLLAKRPYIIKNIGGLRVAIIGVAMGNLVSGFLTPETAGSYRALPVVETVTRLAAELRGRSDLIVVVGHILQSEGNDILRKVPDVAVVVEGHDHRGRGKMEEVDGRVAVGCRGYGVELGRLDLEVDTDKKKLASWQWKRIPVKAATIAADPRVKKDVDKWEARVSKVVDVPIGEAKRTLERADLKPLMEEAMRSAVQADFAFMNPGGIRDRLPKGTVMARHIWNVMPFDNMVVVAEVAGGSIPSAVRGQRQIEPGRQYTLALPDYVAENESERAALGITRLEFKKTNLTVRDALIEWTKKKKVLD